MNNLFPAAWFLLFLLPLVAAVHAIVTRRPRRDRRRQYERELRRDKRRQYEQELDRCVAEWKRQIRAGQERKPKNS